MFSFKIHIFIFISLYLYLSIKRSVHLFICLSMLQSLWLRANHRHFSPEAVSKYTERQKKHHFFRVTLTKIHSITINHIWTQISFNSEKHRILSLQKGENAVWSHVIFRKSQKLLTERALSELYGGGLFIKFNSYSFNFNGGLRKHRAGYCLLRTPGRRGKQFLRFLKTDLLHFHRFYLLFDWIKLLVFYMCLLKNKFT